jgi:ADP-glucose pyrophosphorylase
MKSRHQIGHQRIQGVDSSCRLRLEAVDEAMSPCKHGIYIFNAKSMEEVLNNDKTDFGRRSPDVISNAS